jgi:molybdopterin molybdotransferase
LAVAALQKMSGQAPRSAVKIKAIAAGEFKKRAGRQDFQRGSLSEDEQGRVIVIPASGQGSHQLLALANADALVCLPKQNSGVVAGEVVEVWLL